MSSRSVPYDFLIKLLLTGDPSVGKSSLLQRFTTDDSWLTSASSTQPAIEYKIKTIHLDNKRIKLQIWDTAGHERFRKLITPYYRGTMGIMLVYDITNEKSFQHIRSWIQYIEQYANENVVKMVVGTNCHNGENRVIDTSKIYELAKEYNIDFFEVSAQHNINVTEAFLCLTKNVKREIIDHLPMMEPPETLKKYDLQMKKKKLHERYLLDFFSSTTCLPLVLHPIILSYYLAEDLSDINNNLVDIQDQRKEFSCLAM